MHCRMCSQRLPRPGRLCRECERELARARMAGVPFEQLASPVAGDDAAVATTGDGAGKARLPARVPVIVAALSIGAAAVATVHLVERSDAAVTPRSVMLERDLSDLRPRAFVPVAAPASVVGRPAAREPSAIRAAAAAPGGKPAAGPANPKPRVVHISSVASDGTAPIEQLAQRAPAERAAAPGVARPSRYDRVLAFSEALTRCGEQSFFARLVCEERARSRFCDGARDLPQCAPPAPREYGN